MVNTSYLDVGVLRSTLLPNVAFQLSLAVPAYLIGRSTNYLETKDWLWSVGQVASGWYAAVGRHVVAGISVATALRSITYPGWLLLGGATLWGGRLLYRESTRAVKRGADDPRYESLKKEPSGWNKAFFQLFVPEAIAQALITLPFTAPFRATLPIIASPPAYKTAIQALAIGLFTAGLTLEFLADYQLGKHQEEKQQGLLRSGVWSIVRHPNYLGDIMIHSSFPILLFAQNLFNPITILGPITNWAFLRHFGGDKENEASQADRYALEDPFKKEEFDQFRTEKNSVWPAVQEMTNKWTWLVLGAGAAGAIVEHVVYNLL